MACDRPGFASCTRFVSSSHLTLYVYYCRYLDGLLVPIWEGENVFDLVDGESGVDLQLVLPQLSRHQELGAISWSIERRLARSSTWQRQTVPFSSQQATLRGVPPGITILRVQAESPIGSSSYSTEVFVHVRGEVVLCTSKVKLRNATRACQRH